MYGSEATAGHAMTSATIRRLLGSQVQCVLATVCPQTRAPSTHLMAFAVAADLRRVFLATEGKTQKAENMRRSPAVSLLWDDRTGQLEDHAGGTLCTVSGTARLLSSSRGGGGASESEEARDAMLAANPNFSSFMASPSIALFAVDVSHYDLVVGYGSPVRWDPSDQDSTARGPGLASSL
jgi:nitroimidazol reductase NimA-like FMN-containing flavoprotein (pyridoxamine 5'-phosphate oxidase superfamily)